MQNELPKHEIVLLGIGHTNSHVLNMWRMRPIADTRLTCVSNFGVATYSGMLPGTLAGQYQPEEMQIDLVRLCAAAGARLIQAEVTGLDVDRRRLHFADRPSLPFDALSIGIGSQPAAVPGEDVHVLRIKPMQKFLQRLDSRLQSLSRQVPDRPWRIAIVGGGAGGFEIACCLHRHIQQRFPLSTVQLTLVEHNNQILKNMPGRTRALARQELLRLGIDLALGQAIVEIDGEGRVRFADDSTLETDLVLWATSARAPQLLENFNLPQDEHGFLLIRNTLQSKAADTIFAVGDTGTLQGQHLAKAGVYAVRQGPVLWENLQRLITNQPLTHWQPQRSFLTLLNIGDDRAILTYRGLAIHASWCWKLKDTIDRRFMAKYQDYQTKMQSSMVVGSSHDEMFCGGCGCKLPADVLRRVLAQLDNPQTDDVLVGLDQPDDVAVIKNTPPGLTALTTDFFTAFLDDPHLLGQVAAQNALSDLYASGSLPRAALAMVSVPHGPVARQEQFLLEVLDGALRVLRPVGVPIVGGHTIEGEQATMGFTLVGDLDEQQLTSKSGLQPGDQLVLTKPIGTGVLLAAHQQARCRSDWRDSLVNSMLASNLEAGQVARELGISALTDVTGFGLAGHLWEMLEASQVSADISLTKVPTLVGAAELVAQGIESTLAPGNRQVERHLHAAQAVSDDSHYGLLFDPQTSGGLLIGVPAGAAASLVERLASAATVIGQVIEREGETPLLHVLE